MTEIEKIFALDEKKISDFLDVTKDPNPIHRTDKITPGMYLIASLSGLINSGSNNCEYKGGEFKFKKPSYFPCEVLQKANIEEKERELIMNVSIENSDGVLLEGVMKYTKDYSVAEEIRNFEELKRIREEEIFSYALDQFYRSIFSEKNDTAMKNFLLSFIPGALLENFTEGKGIYVKQQALFNPIDKIAGKKLEVYATRLNHKKISKVRTVCTLDGKLAIEGYALAVILNEK